MIVIGAVLLVLAALAAPQPSGPGATCKSTSTGFGVDSTTNVLWVFCAGAVAMLLLVLALAAFRRGARRRRAKRRELEARRAEGSRPRSSRRRRGAGGSHRQPGREPAARGRPTAQPRSTARPRLTAGGRRP